MRRVSFALLFVVAACTSAPHWVDADAHVVGGYWVRTEVPCDLTAAAACSIDVGAAIAGAGLRLADVTTAATAGWPVSYVDGRGSTIMGTYAGLSQPGAVVLDLADGTRRVVGVMCGGPTTTGGGAIVSPRTCDAWPEGAGDMRVGHEPWLDGS